jgi:hypothetical protein
VQWSVFPYFILQISIQFKSLNLVSVSSEIQGIDDAKILELMKGKPNYFKDPVSDDLSVTFVNVDSKVSQTYRLFNGDNLSGRLCYAYWKVVEYFMELQPARKIFSPNW